MPPSDPPDYRARDQLQPDEDHIGRDPPSALPLVKGLVGGADEAEDAEAQGQAPDDAHDDQVVARGLVGNIPRRDECTRHGIMAESGSLRGDGEGERMLVMGRMWGCGRPY